MKFNDQGLALVKKELALVLRNKKQTDQVVDHILIHCLGALKKYKVRHYFIYRVPGRYTVSGWDQTLNVPLNFFDLTQETKKPLHHAEAP